MTWQPETISSTSRAVVVESSPSEVAGDTDAAILRGWWGRRRRSAETTTWSGTGGIRGEFSGGVSASRAEPILTAPQGQRCRHRQQTLTFSRVMACLRVTRRIPRRCLRWCRPFPALIHEDAAVGSCADRRSVSAAGSGRSRRPLRLLSAAAIISCGPVQWRADDARVQRKSERFIEQWGGVGDHLAPLLGRGSEAVGSRSQRAAACTCNVPAGDESVADLAPPGQP